MVKNEKSFILLVNSRHKKSASNKNGENKMLQPDKISTNFTADMPQWGKLALGTLVMKPEYKEKGLDDILDDAGLGFQVGLVQNHFVDPVTGIWTPSKSHSIIRMDTSAEIGYGVTLDYQPMSYSQIMGDFFGDLKNLGGIPTRAISFSNGSKGAIQFLFGEWLVSDRPHKSFLNFYAGHTGKTAIEFNSSDVCIVCGNTYALSKADKTLKFSVRHTEKASQRLMELRNNVLNMQKYNEHYYQLLNDMARYSASGEIQKAFIHHIFPQPKNQDGTEKISGNKSLENQRAALGNAIAISVSESNKPADKVTIYDLFAGITRYTNYRTQNRNAEEQLEYVTNGPGSNDNAKGFNWLQSYVKENNPVFQLAV